MSTKYIEFALNFFVEIKILNQKTYERILMKNTRE